MIKKIMGVLALMAAMCFAQEETAPITDSSVGLFIIKSGVATNGVMTIANKWRDPWYVESVDAYYNSASVNNTCTLSRVVEYTTVQYNESNVLYTNDIGIVETNWFHSITNVLNVYLTNDVAAIAVTNLGYSSLVPPVAYIQHGDSAVITLSDTDKVKVRVVGRR